jgi:hypothetical protein
LLVLESEDIETELIHLAGKQIGVEKDEEGLEIMDVLGRDIA